MIDENIAQIFKSISENIRKAGDAIGKEGQSLIRTNPNLADSRVSQATVLHVIAQTIDDAIVRYAQAPPTRK